MADCKDIDAALAKLSSKIDGLNGRLNNLEKEQKRCCDLKNENNDKVDLEPIYKRLAAIEKYINLFDDELKSIATKIQNAGKFLGELLDIVDLIFEKIINSINLFTKLFKFFK